MCYQCCRFSDNESDVSDSREKNECDVHTAEFNKKAGMLFVVCCLYMCGIL